MKILLADNGMPFDLNTPYVKPLGGSETSILLLAKGLKELGHQVVLLGNTQIEKTQDENIILDSINNFDPYAEIADKIILNRFLSQGINDLVKNKDVYFYTHDAYDQANVQWLIQPGVEYYFKKIFCVSEWQKSTFVRYFQCDPDKLEVIGNPIDYSLYYGYTDRLDNRLIYSSVPFKGADSLTQIFNDVNIKSGKRLELHVFSSFGLYGRDQEDQQYAETFRSLANTKGIYLHKPISMRDLAYEFMRSSLLIHPSTYHETFGRVFTESMAAGCIPVTVNKGANKEVIGEHGCVVDYPNVENIKCYESFVNSVCEMLDSDLYGTRTKARQKMKKWNYINIARKVESYLGG